MSTWIRALAALALCGCTTSFPADPLDAGGDSDAPESTEAETWPDPLVDPGEDVLDAQDDEYDPSWDDGTETVAPDAPDLVLEPDPDGEDGAEEEPVDPDYDEDGWTVGEGDCCDSDGRVFPGQTMWFSAPYACPAMSWDYDCSGAVELEAAEEEGATSTQVIAEGCWGEFEDELSCDGQEGWHAAPDCGEDGYYEACHWNGVWCAGTTVFWDIVRCH